MKLQNSLGIHSKVVSLAEAREICPALDASDAVGFTYHARDGHADPFLTTFAFLEAAKRFGVVYHKNTEVTGITVKGGKAVGVDTTRGHIDADLVINCAGAYAQVVAKMAGVEIPNWGERHEIMITEPVDPGVCPPMLMSFSGNYYIQQRPHGSIICGMSPAGHPQDFKNRTTWQFITEMSKVLNKLLPATKGTVRHDPGRIPDHRRDRGGQELLPLDRILRTRFHARPGRGENPSCRRGGDRSSPRRDCRGRRARPELLRPGLRHSAPRRGHEQLGNGGRPDNRA